MFQKMGNHMITVRFQKIFYILKEQLLQKIYFQKK